MAPRKRDRDEIEDAEALNRPSLLDRIRDMWEFAVLMQYIFTFGEAVKIDKDFDIEDLETECLKPGSSDKLEDIGLSLLKWISSHRGLTLEIWDEYTRRQYLAKAPHRNPYGEDEEPKKFRNFDIFQKIRVLHQLSIWTFWNAERMREKMPSTELDQTLWRIEELGYDRKDRLYYLLDDNRLYRRTDPPVPAEKWKPKANTLKAQAARRRASKRRRLEDSETPEVKEEDDVVTANGVDDGNADREHDNEDTSQGYEWECVAITLAQYEELVESIKKSKDPNEKILRQRLEEEVMPVILRAEESQRRKIERKEKELMNLERLAGAKRSSRLADKHDRERQEREAAEAERKRAADLAAAHREKEQQEKMEQARQSRMMTREQRIKDREFKRLLHEEELAKIEEEAKKVEAGETRGSERHLKAQLEKTKKDLEELSAAEDWVFDCSGCGVHGKNVDDGSHSMACEKCNVWQHSKCLGISKADAEKEDFHFLCKDCKQRIEDAKKPKISLKFRTGLSKSPPQARHENKGVSATRNLVFAGVEIPKKRGPGRPPGSSRPSSQSSATNGNHVPTTDHPPGQSSSPYSNMTSGRAPNGFVQYTGPYSPTARSPPIMNISNGHQSFHVPHSLPIPTLAYPPHSPVQLMPNGYGPRPGSSSGQSVPALYRQYSQPQQSLTTTRPSSSHGQHPPYYNGVPHQYQNYPPPPQPTSSHTQNFYPPNQSPTSDAAHRVLSPIANRPLMSPTQGNRDVGPIPGIPQKSPTKHDALPPQTSPAHYQGTPTPQQSPPPQHYRNSSSVTPSLPLSRSPDLNLAHGPPQHLSGLSPTKHSPPPPQHQQFHLSHHSPTTPAPQHLPTVNHNHNGNISNQRSVSSTPIFPPVEKLAPSPKQLNRSPVPTPSKSPVPVTARPDANEETLAVQEMKRVDGEVVKVIEQGGE